jgi:DNA-binding LacI/PurR family transcriptional regulator
MPPEKPLRLSDIAEEAGVSIVTAAKVLNHSGGKNTRVSEATAERVRQIAARHNYLPNLAARQLRLKKSDVIGVVMDTCAPQIYHDLLSQMEMYAAQKGYRFMIAQTHENIAKIKRFAHDFVSYGVDGIICLAHQYPGASAEIARIYSSLTHTVFLEKPDGPATTYSVGINLPQAFADAVTYLHGQRRRRIGLLLLQGPYADRSMGEREKGYRQGLKKCGLEFDPTLVVRVPIEQVMDENTVLERVTKCVCDSHADAILATDDIAAAIARETMQELGPRLPDLSDLDDQLVQRLVPNLAGVVPSVTEIANAVVNGIITRIPFLGGRS